jgi:hypothetical protein
MGNRQHCVTFLTTPDTAKNWKDVKIIVYDAPQMTDKPYSQRLQMLQSSKIYTFL